MLKYEFWRAYWGVPKSRERGSFTKIERDPRKRLIFTFIGKDMSLQRIEFKLQLGETDGPSKSSLDLQLRWLLNIARLSENSNKMRYFCWKFYPFPSAPFTIQRENKFSSIWSVWLDHFISTCTDFEYLERSVLGLCSLLYKPEKIGINRLCMSVLGIILLLHLTSSPSSHKSINLHIFFPGHRHVAAFWDYLGFHKYSICL